MQPVPRRAALLSAAALALPRVALAQADQRPTVTIAVQKVSNSNTLEPPREQSNVGFRVSSFYAEPLIETDWIGDLGPRPGLATAWRRIDARTLEFDLRQGVRFHDGTTMTAEDVVFSLGERLFGSDPGRAAQATRASVLAGTTGKEPPAEVVAVSRRAYPGLERIEIVRPGVVRYVNAQPDVTLEARNQQNIGVVFSRAAFAAAENWLSWARRPIGTGPYRIAELRPDVSLTLEAHDEYWGGRPPVRRIRLVEVPEVSGRVNGLFSGEFDFACDIPPDMVAVVERNPRFEVLGSPINNIRIMGLDKTNPVLANPLVRRAITHAVDRRMIVDALWAGRTAVPRGLQLENYGEMYLRDWENPRFDPAEARRLLRAANYRGEPITYRLLNNYYTNQVSNAQIVVEMWRQVGLNVQIEMRENFDQVTARTPGRAIRDWSNTSTFGDPVAGLLRSFGPRTEAERNGEWTNDEFDTVNAALLGSTDMAQRRALFRRLLEIAEREDPAYLVLHQAAAFTAKRKDVAWRASKGWPLLFGPGQFGMQS
jgi:peptide/nickel transport system substrate-binding protein